ncbi:MAG: 4-hydroxythreonine-4-phosphate dehydrogenase PdxA [Synergistaceae bacterium]|jgi:4-hydroxythreonine-4-phosphate dehydrogenase|nr:4-hydroxythreonine-4-phosphate dehydrogenase PdxA [Synergistaceae bacterium]
MEIFRPILGISMGDPGGIGPEVAVKALDDPEVHKYGRPLIVGDARIVEDALRFCDLKENRKDGRPPLELNVVKKVADCVFEPNIVNVYDLENMPLEELRHKTVTALQGKVSFEYVAKVIELALKKEVDATVTGPINKAALNLGGCHYSGHTEIYADLTKTRDYTMMLADGNFRVSHVSTHVSLRTACDRVKTARVLRVIELTWDALKKMKVENPRIAVAGLNPHCGEGGLFGTEDDVEIRPAVEQACEKGMTVEGPLPADTVFSKMLGGMYDAVVCMYHDQGHIPTKLVGFKYDEKTGQWGQLAGVNITLGLPIVRTSVDHGTAFGKAGEGRANPQSMKDALRMAAQLVAQ